MQKVVFLLLIAQSFVQSFRAGNSMLPDLCRSGKLDIGFLLDISSMSRSQFKREVAIMKGIAKAFSIGLGSNRAGLVTFNNKATTVIRRGDTAATSISEFEDRVRNLRPSGRAYIERGLDKVTNSLYDPGEDIHGHRKILFVLTDGRQDRRVDLELHTQDLMQFRVKIIVIAMGSRPKARYINALVEDTMRDIVRSRNSRTRIGKTVHDAIQAVCLKRPSPPGPSCKSKVDLAFLLDASGSIGRKNWPKEPKFVMDVLEKLGDFELAEGVRAGVIIYSSKSYVNFWIKLNDFNSIAEFRKKLNSFKYIRGKATAISDALTMAKNELFQLRNGDRPDAPDTLVLITDGVQNPPLKPGDTLNNYARPLRQAGVTTIAVGVGEANVNELQMIAGDPNRYFTLDSINDLGKAVQFVSSKVCDSCEVNIAFVLDASTTTLTYYDHEKKLVNFISTRLQVGSSESKAAVVSFSDNAKLDIGFDQYQDSLESYTIALRFLRNKRGRTNIQKGLLSAENEFKNPRTGVRLNEKLPKVIVLISDGLENEGSAAGTAARLRSEGFHIVAVSLGRPDMRLLGAITGSKKLIFDVNYRNKDEVFFNNMVGKVVLGVCKK